jgi:hypothetical protein
MPLRFQRRIRISPGASVNLNKRSISASFGLPGAHITIGSKGRRITIGLPGTGISYTTYRRSSPGVLLVVVIIALAILGFVLWRA